MTNEAKKYRLQTQQRQQRRRKSGTLERRENLHEQNPYRPAQRSQDRQTPRDQRLKGGKGDSRRSRHEGRGKRGGHRRGGPLPGGIIPPRVQAQRDAGGYGARWPDVSGLFLQSNF